MSTYSLENSSCKANQSAHLLHYCIILGGILKTWRCGTWGHRLGESLAVLG